MMISLLMHECVTGPQWVNLTHWGLVMHRSLLYPQTSWRGNTGLTSSIYPSVGLSICRRHGFRSVGQVCFGSISDFMCMLIVAQGRSLYWVWEELLSKWLPVGHIGFFGFWTWPPGCHIRFFGFWTLTLVWLWMSVYPKNFHDSSDICPMGFIYSIQICEISHQTFGPSHRKCPMCPMIFMNTGMLTPNFS